MIAIDTSVAIAAFASWHEAHAAARRVLADGPAFPSHVVLETFSVLTRLPAPHRSSPGVVAAWLEAQVAAILDPIDAAEHLTLVSRLSQVGISGGATYDALVGSICLDHGAQLVTNDARALPIYDALGVRVVQLDG